MTLAQDRYVHALAAIPPIILIILALNSFTLSLSLSLLASFSARPSFVRSFTSFYVHGDGRSGGVRVIFGASCVSSLNMHAFRGHASSEPFAAPGPTAVEPFLFHTSQEEIKGVVSDSGA